MVEKRIRYFYSVFGNSGLHLVLKGAVHPQIEPHIRKIGQPIIVKCPTPEPPEEPLPMVSKTTSSAVQRQTAVTSYFPCKEFLFFFALAW